MGLLQEWQAIAFNEKTNQQELQRFWNRYFLLEKGVYEKLLTNPDEVVEGTVKDWLRSMSCRCWRWLVSWTASTRAWLPPMIWRISARTPMSALAFDKERLYKNMVDAKADWLYELPQWKEIFSEEKLHELYLEQKKSGTVIKKDKVYPNDPCPCGSGKKYKKCCGRNK